MPKRLGPPKPCECGCGLLVRRRFAMGHNSILIKRKRKSPVDYVSEDRGYRTPCWIWKQAKSAQGYGMVTVKNQQFLVHRVMYEQKHGAIPKGLELDHLCRNRDCVNPDHTEPVTHEVNLQRSPRAKVTPESVLEIRLRAQAGEARQVLADEFGIHVTNIYDIINRRTWKGI